MTYFALRTSSEFTPYILTFSTGPTDLESTSVVFVYGLDLYCTRVTPSKGFDLLKDDFDYYIIAAVLLALVLASVGSRKFSQLKNLKMAWR